jgi:D-alanyl-D-alanine carboxypeptidase
VWHKSIGIGRSKSGALTGVDDYFRVGSVGKLLTATRVLQLAEQNLISIEQPINEILEDSDLPAQWLLSELSVVDGVNVGGSITVKELLTHRSGLADYLFGQPHGGISLPEAIVGDVTGAIPSGISQRQWSSSSLLEYFFESGLHKQPFSLPSEEFNYTDTNYLILGLIIEKVTGFSLADNLREGIYNVANMTGTYLEWYEPRESDYPIDHYLDASALGFYNINFVEEDINTSMDWGGGGIVSNTQELKAFLTALLLENKLLNSESLSLMKRFSDIGIGKGPATNSFMKEYNYGMGLTERVYQINENQTVSLYGHDGFYGIYAYFEPSTDTTIILALNQANNEDHWIGDIVKILDKGKLFGLSL